jgi:hypothetical protein
MSILRLTVLATPKRIPAHVAEELARIFLHLHRVGRLLRTSGVSWNDAAAAISPQPGLPLGGEVVPLHAKEQVRWIKRGQLLGLIDVIERAGASSLGERSRTFLGGLRVLAAQYPSVRLSAKQTKWLDGLAEDAQAVLTEEDRP